MPSPHLQPISPQPISKRAEDLQPSIAGLRLRYLLGAALLLIIEAAIALFLDDPIIRPYGGDSLAVVLVYLVIRGATRLGSIASVLCALATAFAIEVSQWYHFVEVIGLGRNPVVRAVLGTGFDPRDFLAYSAGAGAVLILEHLFRARRATN
ncbi:DUF2809 domain-containing protein [Sphingomonas xinjiangensis]|uniref:DUF2809 domain-containing protein n=1 Tax=Sphingomonas xinjiangensis TaxID=643568 RepID=A0A840YS10_9SPHN|nr:DUF2809 domain-containing protein [Sphingomonas xinjiangensis]MBB5712460.1 hypothetical protein [Sphingomonas xinjiangensis]